MRRVQIPSLDQLAALATEAVVANTDKVTKISPNSVLSGIVNAIATTTQAAFKDISIVESRLFPDFASGIYLDEVAPIYGASPRKGATGSSTFVRIFGAPNTVYTAGVHNLIGQGLIFVLEENFTVPAIGYGYAKIRSIETGVKTNVPPLSINKMSPVPPGHLMVANEYAAVGGADQESDLFFRERIKYGANIGNYGSIERLNQIFQETNDQVLRTIFGGLSNYKSTVYIITRTGQALSQGELDELTLAAQPFLTISEQSSPGDPQTFLNVYNIGYYPIDVDITLQIKPSANVDVVRAQMQTRFSKIVDFTQWHWDKKIEWDDLLAAAKSTDGVEYVSDTAFMPRFDFNIPKYLLPRFRGFILRNLAGTVLSNTSGTLNPVYYQNV